MKSCRLKQKFHRGDLVRVAKDLGPEMQHFYGAGKEAMVVASYNDLFGTDKPEDCREYELKFKKIGTESWYQEDQLTMIKRGPKDLVAGYGK